MLNPERRNKNTVSCLSEIFVHIPLTSNHMIFLVQFGINKHLYIFQRPQIALAQRTRVILFVFEKFTCAYLFQIELKIMRLPIQIVKKVLFSSQTTNDNCFFQFIVALSRGKAFLKTELTITSLGSCQ